MCYFTYKFYKCKHRAEDHIVKCEKKKNDGSGTHCNPDQRGYKNLPECGIATEDLNSLCKSCVARERKRRLDEAEAEAIKRDIERTRLLDLEEQRRSAAAHEAHMKMVQGESLAEWERQEADRLKQILKESMERQQQEQASHLSSVMEASRREYAAHMEDQYGEAVEDGSSREQAIRHKSTMDWHHPRRTSSTQSDQHGMAELQMKMSSSFAMSESHQRASSATANSSTTNIPPPPPPPLPPTSTSSGSSAKAIHSKASLRASSTAESAAASASSPPPPPPPPPLSPASASMHSTSGHSACLKKAVHSHSNTNSTTESMPRAPAPPKPAFPPVNYSQPPQDQNYGRFMIGTRHQPIHPTQEVPETPAPPPKPPAPRAPAPAVRLAGSVTPAATLAPTGFQLGAGDLQNRLRSSTSVKRPAPRPPVANEQPPNELEAIWNRRGIQREVDDDDDVSTSSLTPSQSASQVSTHGDDAKDEGKAGNVQRP